MVTRGDQNKQCLGLRHQQWSLWSFHRLREIREHSWQYPPAPLVFKYIYELLGSWERRDVFSISLNTNPILIPPFIFNLSSQWKTYKKFLISFREKKKNVRYRRLFRGVSKVSISLWLCLGLASAIFLPIWDLEVGLPWSVHEEPVDLISLQFLCTKSS